MSFRSESQLDHAAAAGASPRVRVGLYVPALYAISVFVSATLLFTVQPMFARMVLPLLGGSPADRKASGIVIKAVRSPQFLLRIRRSGLES